MFSKLNTFLDLFQTIEQYRNHLAFIYNKQRITYGQFIDDIIRVSNIFSFTEKYVLLNLKSKYYFAISYLGVILSGNRACLQSYDNKISEPFTDFPFELKLDDTEICNCLVNPVTELNYNPTYGISTVICSSGTTATPKAIALSEENIMSNLVAGMKRYEYIKNGRFVNILPYTHCFGLICDLLAPLVSGSCICLTDNLLQFFEALQSFNPTALNLTPGLSTLLLTKLRIATDCSSVVGKSLYKILSGGAATPLELYYEFQKYNILIYSCYGLTECTCGVAINGENCQKKESCGKPVDCNSVTINKDGVITIKGKNVMLGYLNRYGLLLPLEEAEWISQDVGHIDVDGYLFVEGRYDDLLIFSDGTKLMPQLAENYINGLEGVQESLVFLKNDVLYASVFLKNSNFAPIVKDSIRRKSFLGHRINIVNILDAPLEKNQLGKVIRKNGR